MRLSDKAEKKHETLVWFNEESSIVNKAAGGTTFLTLNLTTFFCRVPFPVSSEMVLHN
jgi:hypothetical protein